MNLRIHPSGKITASPAKSGRQDSIVRKRRCGQACNGGHIRSVRPETLVNTAHAEICGPVSGNPGQRGHGSEYGWSGQPARRARSTSLEHGRKVVALTVNSVLPIPGAYTYAKSRMGMRNGGQNVPVLPAHPVKVVMSRFRTFLSW